MSRPRPGTRLDPRACPVCGRVWEHDGWRWSLVGPEPKDRNGCLSAAVYRRGAPTLDDVLTTIDLAALTALPPPSQEWWLEHHAGAGAAFARHYLETLRGRGLLDMSGGVPGRVVLRCAACRGSAVVYYGEVTADARGVSVVLAGFTGDPRSACAGQHAPGEVTTTEPVRGRTYLVPWARVHGFAPGPGVYLRSGPRDFPNGPVDQ